MFSQKSYGYYEKAIDPKKKSEMNGIIFEQYKNFPNNACGRPLDSLVR